MLVKHLNLQLCIKCYNYNDKQGGTQLKQNATILVLT